MNIAQAKQIPLRALVEHFGGRFSHEVRSGEVWYYSPFRPDETTASFKVDERKNEWHDFGHVSATHTGQGSGGDIINLWCDFHDQDRKSIKDALKGLEAFSGRVVATYPKQITLPVKKPRIGASKPVREGDRFKLLKPLGKIFFPSLKEELARRGISADIAAPFLQQAYIQDTQTLKKYNGFAFRNDAGGIEVSIPNPAKHSSFKTCIGPKSPVSFTVPSGTSVAVFEGMFDFLTWQEMNRGRELNQHIYILNSLSFIGLFAEQVISKNGAVPIVEDMLDNDAAGEDARLKLAEQIVSAGLSFHAKNHLYQGFKDLNQWWTDCPTASQDWQKIISPAVAKVYHDMPWNQANNPSGHKPG